MDAITMLKADHKTVEKLFKRFEKAGDGALKEKRAVVDEIIRELSVHAAVEEQVFYPAIREAVDDAEDEVLESLEEHHIVKWVLSELDGMDPGHERFDAKVTVLMENVRHHVEEEEQDLFPKVREVLKRKALTDLGESMDVAKRVAPTRPHPRQPDEPPGNIVGGVAAGALDRAREVGKEAVAKATSRGRKAAGQAKATTTGRASSTTRSGTRKRASSSRG
ncbi:MAG: hemerythrin domain-containing protein [Actinobacteria bacterium]|nr:hemerythrin domain-containing protein [Actinomycetota bacterium]